jgi:periplasmic divalent cation tolerance protein
MTICFAYITAPDVDTAKALGSALVEERLAACINMIPNMTSIYRWQGNIETGEEVVVIAKTRADLMDTLTSRVTALHPDDTPCVLALPVAPDMGNADFRTWLVEETAQGS